MPEEREARWYVIHTYSGYEKSVKDTLDRYVENHGMGERIQEVWVPEEKYVEVKDGVRKEKTRNKFPGYVLIKLVFGYEEKEDKSLWYLIRNIRGVTGFVGPESKPVPLTEREMIPLGIKPAHYEVDFQVGDQIEVISGIWQGTVGRVKSMDQKRSIASIGVDMFGRETDVEISFLEIKKI